MHSDNILILEESDAVQISADTIRVVYCGECFTHSTAPILDEQFDVIYKESTEPLLRYLFDQSLRTLPDAVVLELGKKKLTWLAIKRIREAPLLKNLIIIIVTDTITADIRREALALKVNDLYQMPLPVEDMCKRILFLVQFDLLKPELMDLSTEVDVKYEIAMGKRLFDVLFSMCLLILLSPLFLLIAIAIKLESRGPAIYTSKRVGAGYRIFNFYKFRSMYLDADIHIHSLTAMNQYQGQETSSVKVFNKFVNDPRVTRVGRFLRNTSLDELPQLINVLIGDMSLVGNRPLPLYEAELLTSNEWALRFLGPAGLTGLWQVSRRGKEKMSERERKKLDNYYAKNHSLWLDLKILLKTMPAMIQKEKV